MSFPANVLMVMVASPGDVKEERTIITEELYRWNNANAIARRLVLQPVKWETHSAPETGAPAQELINTNLLHDADILVGVFGNRIGTPTEKHPSGTVEEIRTHIVARKQAMIYFSRVPVDISTVDFEQRKAVETFQAECRNLGMYSEYKSYDDFRSDFKHHLDIVLNRPEYVWLSRNLDIVSEATVAPALSEDAKRLIVAAAQDSNGSVLSSQDMGGFHVQVKNEELTEGNPRSAARWKRALREVESRGLLEENGHGIYALTDEGFAEADAIEREEAEQRAQNKLSEEAVHILRNAKDQGTISIIKAGGGFEIIVAGRKQLIANNARELATWNAALEDLSRRGLIERKSPALYKLTKLGFDQLESLDQGADQE